MKRLDDFEPLRESTRQERNLCLLFIMIFSGSWTKKGTPAELAEVDSLGIFLDKEDPVWFVTALIYCFFVITTAFAINLSIDSHFHRMHRIDIIQERDVRDVNLKISLYLFAHWVFVCIGYFKVFHGFLILKKIIHHP